MTNLISPYGGELVDLVSVGEQLEELRDEAARPPDGTNLRKSGLRPRAHGDRGLFALGSFHERRGLPVGRR